MTDEKYEFFDEVKEKSIIARSARAYAQKPKRRYTKRELNAMNGPTHSVNPKKYITYNAFKALPDSLKKTYLESVIATWHIGAAALARMWGITAGTMSPIMKRLGVKGSSVRTNKADTDRFFAEFVNADSATAPTKKNNVFFGQLGLLYGHLRRAKPVVFLEEYRPAGATC